METWKCSKCGLSSKPHYDLDCIEELVKQRDLLLKELNKEPKLKIGPPLEFNGHGNFDLDDDETSQFNTIYYCDTCKDIATCVGWQYTDTKSDSDTFRCSDHCNHDCCASVVERQRDPNWVSLSKKE